MKNLTAIRSVLLVAMLRFPLAGQQSPAGAPTPTLEDLMNVQVTSVSRREQNLADVGAAVSVLTAEDIRRSGATNIPDLLRLVPGVDVAQVDAHTWAISIRGYNDVYANKVLVVIDGRSVYSPLYSGVNWDQQDVPLEDIDRIEVIRGPAGTIWGANAVNGVISITTKKSDKNEGGLVRAGASSRGNSDGLVQYGGAAGSLGTYRAFASYQDTVALPQSSSVPTDDDWHSLHGGVRMDMNLSPRDSLSVHADTERMEASNTFILGSQFRSSDVAADVVARWDRTLANSSEITLTTYYDWYDRVFQGAGENRNTFNVDFQHHLTAGPRHDIVWGLGYRITADQTTPGAIVTFLPADKSDNLFSAFMQDEIRLSNAVSLTLGSKIEHNSYTGFEYEPSAQLVFRSRPKQQFWFSFARAIREPSRDDTEVQADVETVPLPSGGTALIEYLGTPGQQSEKALTWEVGHRNELAKKLSLDATLFYSSIHNLSALVPGDPFLNPANPGQIVLPSYLMNIASGRTYGGELYLTWAPSGRWKLNAGYSVTHIGIDTDVAWAFPGSTDSTTPRGQFQIRSLFTGWHGVEFDTSLFQVSALGGGGSGNIAGYTRLDARVGRHFGELVDISVVGQNLLQPTHVEFGDWNGDLQSLVTRSIYSKFTLRF